MIRVEDLILNSRESRTEHLDMSESCIERGGNSTVHRGVLAQYLGTDMPSKVDLCHNCGNGKCSNPKHLYWGTRKENIEDSKRHGTWKSGWDNLVKSMGLEEAKKHMKKIGNQSKAGLGNKGKKKTEEHKQKISESLKKK